MSATMEDFRDAFRTHPAGVALITATVDGEPAGLTLSSLTSLSLDPLAVAFSFSRTTGSAGKVLAAPSYVIHLLGEFHAELAKSFATSEGRRFTTDQEWTYLDTGEPYLRSAPHAFRARTLESVPVGESRMIAAEILDSIPGPESGRLVYQDRAFFSTAGARIL